MHFLHNTLVRIFLSVFFFCFTSTLLAQHMVKDGEQDGLMKTVSYNVSSFTDLRDKKLQDVMMKMPGLNGSDNSGGVYFTYNGMEVSRIYVNGADVLEGNKQPAYNLKPEDVERIEITENHVSINLMRGKQYSNTASINVILKDSASGKWSGSLKAMAGGTPALGTLDFNGLNLGPKVQTTVMVKGDNTGLDFTGPLHGFGDYGSASSGVFDKYTEDSYKGLEGVNGSFDYMLRKFLDVQPALAPLSSERVRFNRSGIAQVSSTYRLSRDYQLNVQFALHGNRLTANSSDETTFFNGTEGAKLSKFEDAKSHQYDWQSTATLLSNTETQFLRNQFSFHHRRIDMTKDLLGSDMDFYDMNTKPIYLKNDFHIKRLLGEHVFSVNAMAGYNTRPQNLAMDGLKTIAQDVDAKSGYIDLGAKLDFFLGHGMRLSLNAGGAYNARSMNTHVLGEEYTHDSQDKLKILNFFGGASMTYITDKLQAELSLPLVYGNYQQDFSLAALLTESSKSLFTMAPKLSAKYDFTSRFSVTGEVSLNQRAPDRKRLFSGYYFQDTQTIESGYENQIYRNDMWSMNMSATYRNPEHALFANGSVKYFIMDSPYLVSRSFQDLFVHTQYVGIPGIPKGTSFSTKADVNKGIAFLRGKIGLTAEVTSDKTFLLLKQEPLAYREANSFSYTLTPYVNGKLLNWCNMIYKLKYRSFSMQMGDQDKNQTHSITQTLELIFSPWEKINFSLLGEHYYTEFSNNQSKNLVLADFKAEYNLNEKWQLLLTATNILNQDTYNYTLVDSVKYTHSFTSYGIRPRNILLGVFYKF